jgi:hypothetical protein
MRGARFGRQAGVSLIGAVVVMVLLALVFILGAKVLPTLVQYRAISALVKKDAAASKTVDEARTYFDRFGYLSDIDEISGKDLDVERSGDGVVISFAYEKKIPLGGPVSLSIDYAGKSDRGS